MVLVSDPHDTEVKFDRVGDSSGRYNVLNLQRNRNDSSGKTYEFEIIGTYAALSRAISLLSIAFCPEFGSVSRVQFTFALSSSVPRHCARRWTTERKLEWRSERRAVWPGGTRVVPLSKCSKQCGVGEFKSVAKGSEACCWFCFACRENEFLSDEFNCAPCPEASAFLL